MSALAMVIVSSGVPRLRYATTSTRSATVADGALDVHRHQAEEAEHEEREGDGRDRQRREERRAPEGEEGLAQDEAHGAAPSAPAVGGGVVHHLAALQLDEVRAGEAAHEVEVVRRHQHRRARGVDVAQQLEDAAGRALVEVAGRLVGEEDHGVVDQRPREGDALLLAPRELARVLARLAGQPDLREDPHHPRPDARAARARHLQREGDVLLRRPVVEQLEVLEDDAEAPAQPRDVARRHPVRGEARDPDVARRWAAPRGR